MKKTIDMLAAKARSHVENIKRSTSKPEKEAKYAYWGEDVELYIEKLTQALEDVKAKIDEVTFKEMSASEADAVRITSATQRSCAYYYVIVRAVFP